VPELSLTSATAVYELGLDAGHTASEPVHIHAVGDDGSRRRLPIERWLRRAPDDEEQLLGRATGPVLDVGCGAGRHVVALRRRGVEAVGVEISERAVAIARERGAVVIEGSVFDIPEREQWSTALLLDGNIGIGGDPERLLGRVAELLRPGGSVLVELEPPRAETRVLRLRLEGPSDVSDWIPWAWVGADAIEVLAATVGLRMDDLWSTRQRWFASLRREPTPWLP
jgi:SAM-dependent methyltransferase